jgi:transcriptional regulator with XRE-family HTH domain
MARGSHDYAGTRAARMLASALRRKSEDDGVSLRQLAKILGYKQAVVLSHMAHGRVPIPVDRAPDLARVLGLSARDFLLAVLEQRHTDVNWGLVTSIDDDFVEELTAIAGKPLRSLPTDQKNVLREAVADPRAPIRWLSIAELGAVELIRELRPHINTEGLDGEDRNSIRRALKPKG